MMYSPIWRPLQRCVTPGAVELVIETSGDVRGTEHGFDEATAAPPSMQCAHGYSGCSGVLSIGCQVASRF
jgi:hypothetical protein